MKLRNLFTIALLALACILFVGCRTGQQIVMRDCTNCTQHIDGDVDSAQGKSVSGEVSPAVSAGVTAQANGNALSQEGAATASPSGDNDASADSSAETDAPAGTIGTQLPVASRLLLDEQEATAAQEAIQATIDALDEQQADLDNLKDKLEDELSEDVPEDPEPAAP